MNGHHSYHSLVAPHHHAGLPYLPGQWPPFFQGLNPAVLYQNGIQNIDLANYVQRKILKYVIELVQPTSPRPVGMMYRILSSNEFQNQEFYNVVIMTMKCIGKLTARQISIEHAIEEAHKNATGRWLVNYMKSNGQYFDLSHEDIVALGRIEGNIDMFEKRYMDNPSPVPSCQQHVHNGGYGTYQPAAPLQQQNNIDVTSVINSMYSSPGPTVNNFSQSYSEPGLNSGIILSALDAVDTTSSQTPELNTGLQQVNPESIAEQFSPPFIVPVADVVSIPEPAETPVEPEPVIINEPVSDPEPVVETIQEPEEHPVSKTNHSSSIPEIIALQGDKVDFEQHNLRRLLRNGNPNVDLSFSGVEVINSIASAEITIDDGSRKTYGALEGESTDNPDIGIDTIKPVKFSQETRVVVNDDDLRIWLTGETNSVTKTVIAVASYPEASDLGDMADDIRILFKNATTHSEIASIITDTIKFSENDSLRELIKLIDKRLNEIVVEKINFELGLPGSMESYHGSIDSVLSYLSEHVNDISYHHIYDTAQESLYKALSGLGYDVLENVVVVCLTRATSEQFPYIFNNTNSDDCKIGRINPLVTPELHNAVGKVFGYTDALDDNSRKLIRKVYLMTYDGAKIALYRCPFTNCFNVVKETN